MSLTEQQACSLLQVTPSTLNVYVSTRRLSVTRKRTIRGLVVSYDEREVQALKRELQEDHEYIRQQFAQAKSSSKTVEAELIGADSQDGNETNSTFPASASVIERLLVLLEGLTPNDPKVAVEKKLLLTLAEAAVYSGLSEQKLNEAIRAGELKARKDLGRGHRIKREDVESYIESL